MKQFHITHYIRRGKSPMLTGTTYEAEDIIQAIAMWAAQTDLKISDIKYALEL